jgi:hypothetical protein
VPPSDCRLPSNTRPTISPALLTIGDPELPPMMSFVVTKLNGCFGFSVGCALSQLSGSW